jgi:glycerophosphoryl diester phosphodiesterase
VPLSGVDVGLASPHTRSRLIPLIIAHRGASAHAPENTLRAFAFALEQGADAVELDVRLSSDDVVMVAHDPNLKRVAGRAVVICQTRAEELTRIDVGGDTLPRLDDALDLVLGAGKQVNVELKGDVPDRHASVHALVRLLARRSNREREGIFVSSFRPEMLWALRRAHAKVRIAFLFDQANTGFVRAGLLRRALRPDGLHPESRLCTPRAMARWRASGVFVNVWTVDASARLAELAELGVDGVITNTPAASRAALEGARTPG